MNKLFSAILMLSMLISLFSENAHSPQERMARSGWEAVGERDVSVDIVYVMRYSSRKHLSDELPDTDLYDELPASGSCVLYHSRGNSFMDSYACFFDDDGELVFTFDYEEHYALYESYYARFSSYNIAAGELALEYLSECNYISHMINYAHDRCEDGAGGEKNTWYSFTEHQAAWITGA